MLKVFVVGCPRAGTTLVQKLLGMHADVHTCRETHFFQNVRRPGKREVFDYFRLPRHNALRAYEFVRAHNVLLEEHDPSGISSLRSATRFFEQMMTAEASARGKLAWVEKTPAHLFYIPLIKRYIPSTRFVHVIRRGQDVVASLVDVATSFPEAAAWRDITDLRGAIAQYNRCLRESSKYFGNEDHLFVKYERILDDIERVSRKLYILLGLKQQNLHLETMAGIHAQVVSRNEYWKEDTAADIRDTRSVKFERLFDETQQQFVNTHIRSLSPEQRARLI